MNLNLTTEKLQKVLDSGLTFSGWIAINLIKNGETEFLKKSEEDAVFLIMEGWIGASYNLTPKSLKLIETLEEKPVKLITSGQFLLVDMYWRIRESFEKTLGKKQKTIGGKYPFFCNQQDFEDRLGKVIKKYKLKDLEKIEKVLNSYVNRCIKANFEYCSLLQYYIEKNGNSQLATDYEAFVEGEEQKTEFKSQQKFV